jgi:hypothetical protein
MMKFKRHVLGTLIAVGATILLPTQVSAAPAAVDEECSQEILLSYFPGVFVSETLVRFNVPKDQHEAIKKELAVKDKDIIKQVEAKANKQTPNPLKDPQQRQAAVKLFRDTLFENFSAVLRAHGVTDDKQIQAMLDDVQQQKAKRFARCMEKQRAQRPAANSADKSNIGVKVTKEPARSSSDHDDDHDDDNDD